MVLQEVVNQLILQLKLFHQEHQMLLLTYRMVLVVEFLLGLKKEMVQVVVLDYITQVVDRGHQHLQ
jgi:hypothetical protein